VQVTLIQTIKMLGVRYEAGRTYEVTEDVGKALIRGGWAEAFESDIVIPAGSGQQRRT